MRGIIRRMKMVMFLRGRGCIDASGNLTFSEDGHCITLLGVKDLIVVQSGDATMVCHKDKAQQVKALAQAVGEQNFLT